MSPNDGGDTEYALCISRKAGNFIMMRSLYSGVAGLKTHQTKMDVIGNNIANVNTVGYKSQTVTFSDVFYQTTQNASGANAETGRGGTNAKQIGLGSTVAAINTKVTDAGGSQSTNNPFDIMINGDSMFIVNNAGQNYFTKAGNFTVDNAGTLVTPQGYSVQGWRADSEGNIIKTNVTSINLYAPENKYANPVATTDVSISGNVNKEDESFAAGTGRSLNVTFYDSLGYEYQVTVKLTQDADNDYKYTLSATAVTCNGNKVDLGADEDDILEELIKDATLEFNSVTGELAAPADGKISLNVKELGIDSLGSDGNPVTMDFSSMTCLGSDTKFNAVRGDLEGLGAGRLVGSMSGISIQKDGIIVASYDNGDTRVIAQIAVANFTNLSGLEKAGDNLFSATLNSGEFDGIGDDITEDGGYFSTGVLEMSNVDLASEFTDMITTQRGYQANSRIITVSDTMLEELINLKR